MPTIELTPEEAKGFVLGAKQRKEVEVFGYHIEFCYVHEHSIVARFGDVFSYEHELEAILITEATGTDLSRMLERARRNHKAAELQAEKRRRGAQIAPRKYK